MNRDINDINQLLESPALTVYEKIIVVDVNKKKIDNIDGVIKTLKIDNEYITSPVKHVFDRITDNILSFHKQATQ